MFCRVLSRMREIGRLARVHRPKASRVPSSAGRDALWQGGLRPPTTSSVAAGTFDSIDGVRVRGVLPRPRPQEGRTASSTSILVGNEVDFGTTLGSVGVRSTAGAGSRQR